MEVLSKPEYSEYNTSLRVPHRRAIDIRDIRSANPVLQEVEELAREFQSSVGAIFTKSPESVMLFVAYNNSNLEYYFFDSHSRPCLPYAYIVRFPSREDLISYFRVVLPPMDDMGLFYNQCAATFVCNASIPGKHKEWIKTLDNTSQERYVMVKENAYDFAADGRPVATGRQEWTWVPKTQGGPIWYASG